MNRQEKVSAHLQGIADEVVGYIKDNESRFPDRWVPATSISKDLGLMRNCYPKSNKTKREQHWLRGIVCRMLEDENLVEFWKDGKKVNSKTYYRSK